MVSIGHLAATLVDLGFEPGKNFGRMLRVRAECRCYRLEPLAPFSVAALSGNAALFEIVGPCRKTGLRREVRTPQCAPFSRWLIKGPGGQLND
ncbi:MAG TPA: hypothetical protein VNM92_06855 [Thermoanaerobaculia bacterium]|nr:hypothetical protein [Thermoanaerobaculia bacterium]